MLTLASLVARRACNRSQASSPGVRAGGTLIAASPASRTRGQPISRTEIVIASGLHCSPDPLLVQSVRRTQQVALVLTLVVLDPLCADDFPNGVSLTVF